jgi:hypothetical protein
MMTWFPTPSVVKGWGWEKAVTFNPAMPSAVTVYCIFKQAISGVDTDGLPLTLPHPRLLCPIVNLPSFFELNITKMEIEGKPYTAHRKEVNNAGMATLFLHEV